MRTAGNDYKQIKNIAAQVTIKMCVWNGQPFCKGQAVKGRPMAKKKEIKTIQAKVIHVTPCCKTRHWHSVNTVEFQYMSVLRCEFCDQMFDGEDLVQVVKGLNPVTFFCDNCRISAETELIRSQGLS